MTAPDRSPSAAPRSRVPETARNEAAGVGRDAADRASDVAATVGEQARQVASQTSAQARNLLDEGMTQLREQARDGQQKLAESVRTVADQLRRMSDKGDSGGDSGLAGDLVRQATDRAGQVASWLESREPGDLLDEVRRFARRRPGVFLAGAAVAGVLAGRLTRNMVSSGQDNGSDRAGQVGDGSRQQWRAVPPAAPDPAPGTAEFPASPATGQVPPRPVAPPPVGRPEVTRPGPVR